MRNSTRYDLGTTSALHFLCFGCMLTDFNAHGYDLGTTLVRPWYDLSKAWAQAALSIGPAPRRVKNPLLGLRCGKLSFTWRPRHASLVQFLHAQLPFGHGSSCAGHGVVPTLCTRVYYVHVRSTCATYPLPFLVVGAAAQHSTAPARRQGQSL